VEKILCKLHEYFVYFSDLFFMGTEIAGVYTGKGHSSINVYQDTFL